MTAECELGYTVTTGCICFSIPKDSRWRKITDSPTTQITRAKLPPTAEDQGAASLLREMLPFSYKWVSEYFSRKTGGGSLCDLRPTRDPGCQDPRTWPPCDQECIPERSDLVKILESLERPSEEDEQRIDVELEAAGAVFTFFPLGVLSLTNTESSTFPIWRTARY